jgi:hypothetical protein
MADSRKLAATGGRACAWFEVVFASKDHPLGHEAIVTSARSLVDPVVVYFQQKGNLLPKPSLGTTQKVISLPAALTR